MRRWVASLVVLVCALAVSADRAGSPAASLWGPSDTYSRVLPSPHLLAMSVDTVFVCAGQGATSPVLSYLKRSPSAAGPPAPSQPGPDRARPGGTSGQVEDQNTSRARPTAVPDRAGEGGVSVSVSGSGLLEAEPGRIITARFMVGNRTGEDVGLRESVTPPPDWVRVAAAESGFTLGPGEVTVRFLTFHIPSNCPAGTYEFRYEVMDPAAPALGGESAFTVTVLPQLELTSRVLMAPRTVVAGGEFSVQVALANNGNTRAVTSVRAIVRPDYQNRVEPTDLLIPSGESRTVRVQVKTDKHLQQRTMCRVVLEATTEDEMGQTGAIEEVITVDVIPRVTRLTDPYYRLPSWVRLSAAADGKSAGAQVEVSGSGPIAGDTGRNLSYVLRQASTPTVGRYASWNEYWASYRGRHLEVDAGDKVYSLSPLLQRFNYGQGAGARLRLRSFSAGGYYAGERSDEPQRLEIAGFVALRPRPDMSIKANVIEKEAAVAVYDAGARHFLTSVQGRYMPAPGTDFEVEYGFGNEEGGGNQGFRLWAGGVFRNRLYYSLEKVHAGPRFYGYHNDTDFELGTLQYPIKPGTTLRLFYRGTRGNLWLDPEKLTANTERNIMGGVSYMLSPSVRLLVDLQDYARRDRLGPPAYDFGERTVKVSTGYSRSRYSVYGSAEAGYFHDNLGGRRAGLNRYSVSGSFRPGPRQSYNVYGSFGHNKYSEEPRRSDNLGAAGRWQVARNLNMMLDYHMSGNPSLVENTYSILTHSLDYVLPNRHVLTLRTSFWGGRGGSRNDLTVLLSYAIPAPIPLGRKRSVGTVKGRVSDAEDPRQAGVANVIITADGAAAVSNGSGEFEFPSLEPGVYSLQVDAKSIGLGRVTEGRSPFVVVVEGGKTAHIEIGVVRSGSISGEVLMFDLEPNDATGRGQNLEPEGETEPAGTGDTQTDGAPVLVGLGKGRGMPRGARGLPDVLVEITNGEYYLTQYTNSGGEFDFAGLRPGHWTVRIYPEDLPHYYFVETDEMALDVVAGDDVQIAFRILPRQRRINIMDEGEIKLERR